MADEQNPMNYNKQHNFPSLALTWPRLHRLYVSPASHPKSLLSAQQRDGHRWLTLCYNGIQNVEEETARYANLVFKIVTYEGTNYSMANQKSTSIPRPKRDMRIEFGVRIFCFTREGKNMNPLFSPLPDSSTEHPINVQLICQVLALKTCSLTEFSQTEFII